MTRVWDVDTGELQATLSGHEGKVYSVVFSPDGKRIATASQDRTIGVWDAETGYLFLRLRGHQREVLAVAFSRDGRRIISASEDGTVRVWESELSSALGMWRGLREP